MEAKLKKIKRNQVIITGFAIMIAIAGYINYTGNISDIISIKSTSKTEEAAATSNPVDEVTNDILSNDAEPDEQSLTEPGSVVLTSGTGVSSGIISQAKLNREQIRAKNKESLMDIINNAALTETSKAEAVAKLSQITDNSEKEIAAELLLEAKGFEDVVVSMLDGNVDVVVNKTTLTDYEKAQIEDVVKRKTGVTTDKITINVCNNSNN
jgi:stage III sporulation protein AH